MGGHDFPLNGSVDDGHLRITYQDIHLTIAKTALKIKDEFGPDMMIAIGGGGFFPARVLRTYLKSSDKKNIPIQAIGLSLYEELGTSKNGAPSTTEETLGREVIRTQWLDHSTLGSRPLVGRKILIVDEVDDSRTTLGYAISELEKDVRDQLALIPEEDKREEARRSTEFAIFVVHNKLKTKLGSIPSHVKYFAGDDVPDVWIDYPWEQQDILRHDQLAAEAKARLAASSSSGPSASV